MMVKKTALLATLACAAAAHSASAAQYNFIADFGANPTPFFEARWGILDYWEIVPATGADDGFAGIPDGLDTFVIDRNPNPVNGTKLVLDGGGTPQPLTVAGITATGAPGLDIQIKTFDLIIGDLELLASAEAFDIDNERDRDLIFNGVISGPGDLVLSRAGGFSAGGVTPDEVISLGGSTPNTMTGDLSFINTSNGAQPSFWVGDKVGAFGQASSLTLEVNGTGGGTNIAQLLITANAAGGEGAIDDDATQVNLGLLAEINVAAGVDEKIGSGNLLIDLAGTGTFTVVPDGTYDNSVPWVSGDGTVTVIPEPTSLALLGLGGLIIARRRRG